MSKPPVSKPASGAVPPNHQAMDASPFDVRAFRQALGAFVTGVTIVTTLDADGQPAGLTANSFNSVSLDPPMVLWSLALESANLEAFRQASHWAVHVLASGQEHLSIQFASRTHNRFAGVTTTPGPAGIPLLDGYAARFICSAAFEHDGGDHAIFLGRVEAFERTTRTPLVYHQGRYAGVFPAAPAEAPGASITALENRGLVERTNGRLRLSDEGRAVAEGFVALAETDSAALTTHEIAALRHLLPLLG